MTELLKFSSVGQGIPIVLLHGWGLNSAIWQPLAEQLQSEVRVISISLPGFGDNFERTVEPYSLANVSELIVNTINQPAIYLGWSLGGLIATHIALSCPEKVLGLVTVASSPYFVAEDSWAGIDRKVLSLFHRQLSTDTRKTIDNFLKIQAMGSVSVRDDIKHIRDLVMQYNLPTQQTLTDSLLILEKVDLRHQLKEISVPFLRMYGKLDGLVPKKVVPLISTLAPKSEEVMFERASHAPFISDPDAFLDELKLWLKENYGAA
ncbi:pimeloyl-ACP methyl ester esterase BioH [Thalassotalea profundi]|uniref:Pimeloyl-[acyl-carrier protein] methyl ester esterase n=1 Tax=Thalassotalea profundi TaxID=2036687 RepID=A0ABQ3IWD8_9GAMM|nr:pimeloyl-ACP methyl ester esterase BioH [Thalassotalea profundi]GHE96843.1 pimeloyl-[acyl-carrier protein] methyl ester esterase [Thalassotalea profundi]